MWMSTSRRKGGVHQEVDEIIFISCSTLFRSSFDKKSIEKILCTQSYVGHHGGRRHQGQGGVNQEVNIKLLACVLLLFISYLLF